MIWSYSWWNKRWGFVFCSGVRIYEPCGWFWVNKGCQFYTLEASFTFFKITMLCCNTNEATCWHPSMRKTTNLSLEWSQVCVCVCVCASLSLSLSVELFMFLIFNYQSQLWGTVTPEQHEITIYLCRKWNQIGNSTVTWEQLPAKKNHQPCLSQFYSFYLQKSTGYDWVR